MKKLGLAILTIVLVVVMAACTAQEMTYSFGGDMTITLNPGEKLEMITWKDGGSLWYLTRPMRENEEPETHVFNQSSNYGVFEGTVTIVELPNG